MNKEKILVDNTMIIFLEYLEKQSKDTIENISKIVNKKKREIFKENRNKKLGENSKNINEEDFQLILNKCNKEKLKLVFLIMYYMGLRVSEVVEIKRFDIIGEYLNIRNIKSRRIETRRIPKRLIKELDNYIYNNLRKIQKSDNYIFTSEKTNSKLSKDYIRNQFRELTLKLNINKVYAYSDHKGIRRKLYLYSTHSLRHGFAHRFYKLSNNDIEKTRIALRHTLIKDTQNYIKGDLKEVSELMINI